MVAMVVTAVLMVVMPEGVEGFRCRTGPATMMAAVFTELAKQLLAVTP
jgi:hypothetical protein